MQAVFEAAQLRIELAQRRKLGEHQRVVALAEAVQIEYEPTEIAIGELARLAQEACATTHASALSEARRRWSLLDESLGLWRLPLGALCDVVGSCRCLLSCWRSSLGCARRLLGGLRCLRGGLWCPSSCLRRLLSFVRSCHDPHAIRHSRRVSAMPLLPARPSVTPRSALHGHDPLPAGPLRPSEAQVQPPSARARTVRKVFPPRRRAPVRGYRRASPAPARRTPAPRAPRARTPLAPRARPRRSPRSHTAARAPGPRRRVRAIALWSPRQAFGRGHSASPGGS